MLKTIAHTLVLAIFSSFLMTSCMVVDGGMAYRKKNKCCGVIKCDMHRRTQKKKHKHAVTAHKSLRKKEQRIKRGY